MKKIIAVLCVFIFLVSCKKKENTTEPEQTTTDTSSPETLYHGFLVADVLTNWSSGSPMNGSQMACGFLTQTAVSTMSLITSSSYNGPLSFNGTVLKKGYSSTGNFYYDSTNTLNLVSQRNFQLISNTSLPSFTFSNPDAFPIFPLANCQAMNDTLFTSQTLTVSIVNSSGYDEASCFVYDISNPSISVFKVVPSGTAQLTLSSTDLSIFAPGAIVYCWVTLKKYNRQTFSGKNFRFENHTSNKFYMHVQ